MLKSGFEKDDIWTIGFRFFNQQLAIFGRPGYYEISAVTRMYLLFYVYMYLYLCVYMYLFMYIYLCLFICVNGVMCFYVYVHLC